MEERKEALTIIDDGNEVADLETAKKYDEALSFSPNKAGNDKLAEKARKRVWQCLTSAEQELSGRMAGWEEAESLMRLESLSENANDFDVHLGGPFKANEEWVARMHQSVYGTGARLVGGDIMNEGDEDKRDLAFALIEHQLREEAKIVQRSQEDFRMTGLYGTRFFKVTPKREVKYSFRVNKRSKRLPQGGYAYEFDPPEEVEQALDRLNVEPVSVFDFRSDAKGDMDSCTWCGDYSYPNEVEVRELIERGEYHSHETEELLKKADKDDDGTGPNGMGSTGERAIRRNSIGIYDLDKKDGGTDDGLTRFARFEWYGLFDIDGDGKQKPTVITMLLPMDGERADFSGGINTGTVVQLRRNPFAHQKKPYVFHPVIKVSGSLYGISIMDMKGRMSRYEDEMWTLGLVQGQMEASPAIEIGEAAGVDVDMVEGLMPGLRIPVAKTGEIRGIELPQRSGIAGNWAKILSDKGDDIIGLGGSDAAPRVAAAGIITEANKEDLRMVLYVDAFEQYCLLPMAELAHSYNQQYMTHEKKIRTLGISGMGVRDIRTIRPDQVDIDVMFAPVVGKKLRQKVFQSQQLLNLRDRFLVTNQMDMQMGRPPSRDLDEFDRRILKDGIGIADVENLIPVKNDPDKILTAGQEHRLFAAGQRPGVQKGENKLMHFTAHIKALKNEAEDWMPEDKQALIDHAQETLDDLFRDLEAGGVQMADLVALVKEQQLLPYQATMEGREDYFKRRKEGATELQSAAPQGGGRGAAGPGQAPGSPQFRAPGVQGEVMSQAPNMGAQ